MKATEQYFPVVLFIILKRGLTFESIGKILKYDPSNKIHEVVSLLVFKRFSGNSQ